MELRLIATVDSLYLDSLDVTKTGQPDVWQRFVSAVPPFSIFKSRFTKLCAIITRIYYHKMILRNISTYRQYWIKIEKSVILELENMFDFEITYPITANVCITPLFMRDIGNHEFLVPTNAEEKRILQLIVHEISHFYFFESYPGGPPYDEKVWKLSEIIVPYILRKIFPDTYIFKQSYAGEASSELEMNIQSWLNGDYSFSEFIN